MINRFDSNQIIISDNGDNRIECNFLGTDVTGTVALGSSAPAIDIGASSSSNVIGGTAETARNLISGNGTGVYIVDNGTTGNLVQGNFIGTDVTGTLDLGNTQRGVVINGAPSNTIGGATIGARNIISGNDVSGVLISGNDATGNLVLGNFIGTDVTGTADLGNTRHGVIIQASNNTIGGAATGAGNIISGNDQTGVLIFSGSANGCSGTPYIRTPVWESIWEGMA